MLKRPLVLALWAAAAAANAGELQDDLRARRERVMARLGSDAMFVQFSAPLRTYSLDVEYEYRQDSDLLYLTGIDQDDTVLVLMPGNQTKREFLFVSDANPRREHWQGHLLTTEEAAQQSGIAAVYPRSAYAGFVRSIFNGRAFRARAGEVDADYDRFFEALKLGRARLFLLFGPKPGPEDPLPPVYEFAQKARDRYPTVAISDATDVVHGLRQVKTPYERKLLAQSVLISSEAHLAGMRSARPGRHEYEVESAIEAVYLANGASSWGYPSIVGSGPNATILHYSKSARRMEAGDLLLVDAAASYQGLTGDITRSYPVSGTFSEPQRDIYRIVQAAQEAGMRAAVAGGFTVDVERAAAAVVREGLLKLGLISDAKGDQYRTWYTHGICHWIGMDVHDVGDYRRPLEPGMAFVVEPGIYVRQDFLDNLPQTAENKAFVEKVRPAVEKYKGIGIRIEDSFLLTEQGLLRLSAKVPRTLEEVEGFLRSRPR